MDHFIHTESETASQVESLAASPAAIRSPQIVRLEAAEAGGRHVAVFSIDYGDGSTCGALVLFVAPREHIHLCEVMNPTTGDEVSPLLRAIERYTQTLESLARSGAPVQQTARFTSIVPAPHPLVGR